MKPASNEARLDLADPSAARELLGALRAQTDDLIAAALDATEPPGRRDIGRREARRIVTEAAHALGSLFDFAGVTSTEASPTSTPSTAGSSSPTAGAEDDAARARAAWIDIIQHSPTEDARRRAVQGADLGTLLVYALGEPREAAEVEPLSSAVLGAVRGTLDGWVAAARGGLASVPLADLALLARRVDVVLELVRREARVKVP